MNRYRQLPLIIAFFSLIVQGCDSTSTSKENSSTAIGESVSIVTDVPNAEMAPSIHALEGLSTQVGEIVKLHIEELNGKEAIDFNKETNYCDISGLKESEHRGNREKITTNMHYKTCKTSESTQNGEVQITYRETNQDGKFPKALELTVPNRYQFNTLTLNQGIVIESDHITYNEDHSVKSIALKINGTVNDKVQEFEIKNYSYKILF